MSLIRKAPTLGRCRYSGSTLGKFDPFDLAAAGLLLALLILVGLTFMQYAVSNDEGVQQHYGELIIAYYKSGFANRSVLSFDNLYLYGGLFDIISVLFSYVLPFDPYNIRHVLSALAGIGGVAAVWATAHMIAGPRAGFFGAVALAICGVWYGGMYNHTKDVPFASAMMGAAFFLLRALRDAPAPRWRNVLGFGILLGCALGLRASGLLMPCYAVAAILVQTRKDAGWQKYLLTVSRSLARFVPAFALAYVIMIAAWPWAALDLFNPARAIFAFAHFHYPIRTVMAGQVYLMSEVPRWYEPGYLAIKLPIFVLAGAAVAIAFGAWTAVRGTAKPSDPKVLQEIGALLFITIFPLACQVIGRGPSFTGMRHFLFVVPPIATLAGVGIDVCLRRRSARANAICIGLCRNRFRLCLGRGNVGTVASIRIPVLQFFCWRPAGRLAPIRDRLLGQHHAGGGPRSRALPQLIGWRDRSHPAPSIHRRGLRREGLIRE